MQTLWQDFRSGVRMLVKAPAFTLLAVLTLALGIGASTAIFSVVEAVLLRALPYPHPDKLVRVWEVSAGGHRMELANQNFDDFRAQNRTFAELAVYGYRLVSISGGSEPVRVMIATVSGNFFRTLGVEPVRGRTFAAEELRVHGAPAVIVSNRYWRQYLGANPDLSHLTLRMEATVYPVIGVMPADFEFPAEVAGWVPRELDAEAPTRSGHNWRGVGRLRDGVNIAQAAADLQTIARGIRDRYGKEANLHDAAVIPLADALVGDVRTALLTLIAAVTLLLLVACANVAGLLLVRTSARRKEMAVRAALGAGRVRLLQQFLAESLSLSLAGGLLGILLASWAVGLLPAILPENLPRQQTIAINTPVLLFALATIFAVTTSLGLFSAWRASSGDVQQALGAASRGYAGTAGSQRLRSLVVIGEIAATLIILVAAGLLGRSFLRLISTSPGFRRQNLVTMEFAPPNPKGQSFAMEQADVERQVHLMEGILNRLRTIPGVEAAGVAGAMPVAAGDVLAEGDFLLLNGHAPPASFADWSRMAQDRSQTGHALYAVAGESYFQTLGIPLMSGRMFTQQDDFAAPHVAVISQTLARQRWPNQDPIGQMIDFGNMDGNLKPLRIVGIAGDVRARGLNLPPGPIVYVDYRQRGMNANSSPTIVLRSAVPLAQIAAAARGVFRELAPDVPVKFSTFDAEMGGWLADRRFLLLLVGLFALAALSLAAVGIYGVMSFSVARRTQEIGIRMALGACRADVLRLVLGEGARIAAFGVALGIAASLALARLLESLLFGISSTDAFTFAAVSALLFVVALLASYIPTRRAMRLQPTLALRDE